MAEDGLKDKRPPDFQIWHKAAERTCTTECLGIAAEEIGRAPSVKSDVRGPEADIAANSRRITLTSAPSTWHRHGLAYAVPKSRERAMWRPRYLMVGSACLMAAQAVLPAGAQLFSPSPVRGMNRAATVSP